MHEPVFRETAAGTTKVWSVLSFPKQSQEFCFTTASQESPFGRWRVPTLARDTAVTLVTTLNRHLAHNLWQFVVTHASCDGETTHCTQDVTQQNHMEHKRTQIDCWRRRRARICTFACSGIRTRSLASRQDAHKAPLWGTVCVCSRLWGYCMLCVRLQTCLSNKRALITE